MHRLQQSFGQLHLSRSLSDKQQRIVLADLTANPIQIEPGAGRAVVNRVNDLVAVDPGGDK